MLEIVVFAEEDEAEVALVEVLCEASSTDVSEMPASVLRELFSEALCVVPLVDDIVAAVHALSSSRSTGCMHRIAQLHVQQRYDLPSPEVSLLSSTIAQERSRHISHLHECGVLVLGRATRQ